jgi:hypothetical protein
MSAPYHILNEAKSRKANLDPFAELLPYEVEIKYLDEKGRLRYKSKRLGNDSILKINSLVNLVKDIEDEHQLPIKKTTEGWYESQAGIQSYKAVYSSDGDLLGYEPDLDTIRPKYQEYDHVIT